jgi:hypothetical protein
MASCSAEPSSATSSRYRAHAPAGSEPAGGEPRWSSTNVSPRQVRIGFGQHRMPDAAQERPATLRPEAGHRLGDIRRGQVRPPHHAGQQAPGRASARRTSIAAAVRITARRQHQQVGRLPGLGHGLDDHRAGHLARRRQRCQVRDANDRRSLASSSSLAQDWPPISHRCSRADTSHRWWCASITTGTIQAPGRQAGVPVFYGC